MTVCDKTYSALLGDFLSLLVLGHDLSKAFLLPVVDERHPRTDEVLADILFALTVRHRDILHAAHAVLRVQLEVAVDDVIVESFNRIQFGIRLNGEKRSNKHRATDKV